MPNYIFAPEGTNSFWPIENQPKNYITMEIWGALWIYLQNLSLQSAQKVIEIVDVYDFYLVSLFFCFELLFVAKGNKTFALLRKVLETWPKILILFFSNWNPGEVRRFDFRAKMADTSGSHRYHFNCTGMVKEIAYPNKAIVHFKVPRIS